MNKFVSNVRDLRDPKALPGFLRLIADRIPMGADSKDEILHAADELESHQISFDLRYAADMRAIKRWQEVTGQSLKWPDHADLCVWLLERLEAADRAGPEMNNPSETDLFVHCVVRDVAELPDRTSPPEYPEMMLVTSEELNLIIRNNLRERP